MKEDRLKGYISYDSIHLHDTLEKTKNHYGDKNQIRCCQKLGVREERITKGHKETFEDDENILQFDCGDNYIVVWLIKTHKIVYIKNTFYSM